MERSLHSRLDRAIEAGELPRETSSEKLSRYYLVVIQGLALQAQHGATEHELIDVVERALAAWPVEKRARRR
jgi:hypothetical protein